MRIDAIGDPTGPGLGVWLRAAWKRVRVQSEKPQVGVNFSLRWSRHRTRRHLVLHLSRFQTDSYGAHIYEYERDFPGSVSIRPLYGDGWRGYPMIRQKMGCGVVVAVRCQRQRVGGRERRHCDVLTGLQIDYEDPE